MKEIPMDKKVKRISVSLSPDDFKTLDQIKNDRQFQNRSQTISEMINHCAITYSHKYGDKLVSGTITLVYNESKPKLLGKISTIQRSYLDEVISSQHIMLEGNHTMQVLLVQGPANILRELTDKLTSCKGVKIGNLALTSILLPPIHPIAKPASE